MRLDTHAIDAALRTLDGRLQNAPDDASAHFERGQLLEWLGRNGEAVRAYASAVTYDPTHADAYNALGLYYLADDERDAARTAFRGAVLHGPRHAAAHANLAYVYVLDERLADARAVYELALAFDPTLAIAHHGLANVLARSGDDAGAAHHRALGMRYRPITVARYRGDGAPVRVLVLGTTTTGNTPIAFDDRRFLVTSLVVEHVDSDAALPPHDVLFNGISEADLAPDALAAARILVRQTTAPVLNHPDVVVRTDRVANGARLRALAGVVAPHAARFARGALHDQALAYPVLLRSPGYHTGEHFVLVAERALLAQAAATLPGDELLAIAYVDSRDARGDFRKYRVLIVDGRLYPLHLAVSARWKVHYFSSAMADRADFRAEEAAFLDDMPGALGAAAVAALERVRDALALDYGGIDFALLPNGDVLVFEANASMVILDPPDDPIFAYRRAPVARVRDAVTAMLVRRAAPPTPRT